jgi:hypothetical protein
MQTRDKTVNFTCINHIYQIIRNDGKRDTK